LPTEQSLNRPTSRPLVSITPGTNQLRQRVLLAEEVDGTDTTAGNRPGKDRPRGTCLYAVACTHPGLLGLPPTLHGVAKRLATGPGVHRSPLPTTAGNRILVNEHLPTLRLLLAPPNVTQQVLRLRQRVLPNVCHRRPTARPLGLLGCKVSKLLNIAALTAARTPPLPSS
jgi:hypothetical protein